MAPALDVRHVRRDFGGVAALHDVTLTVGPGELVGLIGPNGAGKTTLMNIISGVYPPSGGEVYFDGEPITRLPADRINHLGIVRTFQIPRPFVGMSVAENVTTAALFGGPPGRPRRERTGLVDEVLHVTGLAEQADVAAEYLNVAGRKRLELARALAMRPRLLLLDEVMAGLGHQEMEVVMRIVSEANGRGITVVLIEHVMKAVMSLARRVIVLQEGHVLTDGTPAEIVSNPAVVAAYLGRGVAAGGRRGTRA
jgi:ABC-type branched-subunit amino acid transport system ATPase component